MITRYGGTIDEFMGDGILVLFGAPTAAADDALRAVACAVEMQLAIATVNQEMTAMNLKPLAMGIGINTGEVVVGNIGSEKRTKYGVVGAQVNLTHRIESYTIGGQILISQTTLEQAETRCRSQEVRPFIPKESRCFRGGLGCHWCGTTLPSIINQRNGALHQTRSPLDGDLCLFGRKARQRPTLLRPIESTITAGGLCGNPPPATPS